MNIHEYQAKALMAKFGVPLLKGGVAYTRDEAMDVARKLGSAVTVVKAQIHAGGRGKGRFKDDPNGKGGVRVCKSIEEVGANAAAMLGHELVTKQTGPAGKTVRRLYIEEGCDIKRELYLSMLVDRVVSRISIIASTEGGMDIETVAHDTPDKIVKQSVDPASGYQAYEGRKIAFALGLTGKQVNAFVAMLGNLYRAFTELDCSLVEINPLVVTGSGDIIALDAKMNFDDNALERHKEIESLRDVDEEDPAETEAAKWALNYVKLDGQIGCMVNGAGLAMATMDIIKLYGMAPANFLDVGGGASVEKVAAAFKIITADPNVKGILVNIFGGIMKCDVIADGVVAAVKQVGLKVPLVVRLEGTNVEQGKQIISTSGLNVLAADNLDDAAQKIVNAVKGSK
jgi:succinyl-CoA synthetase beta subunit